GLTHPRHILADVGDPPLPLSRTTDINRRPRGYAGCSKRWSISLRSRPKSMGLGSNPAAPSSDALFVVGSSPYAVIMMTGTFGRSALTFGSISRPLIPGILMSERIKIRDGSGIAA